MGYWTRLDFTSEWLDFRGGISYLSHVVFMKLRGEERVSELLCYCRCMLMWYANIISGCDRRRSRLSDAPFNMRQDTTRTEI